MDSLTLTADLASIIGVPLAIIGVAITFVQVMRAKTAAEAARAAADNARVKLLSVDILSSFDRVIASVRELQYLHRSRFSRSLLHTRYEVALAGLLGLEADLRSEATVYEAEIESVMHLLSEVSTLHEAVENYGRTKSLPDLTKANVTLSKLLLHLQSGRERLRARLGGDDGKQADR